MMPAGILSACRWPRCPNAGGKAGYCAVHAELHRQAANIPLRRSERAFYAGAEWRALRYAVLLRDPICKLCGQARSTQADHIIPRSQGGPDTMENLRGSCHACHSRRTSDENRGDGGRWG